MSEDASETTIIVPPKPRPTDELERDCARHVSYLNMFTQSPGLDPELRMAMNNIQNTLKNAQQTLHRMSMEAEQAHERQVEILRSSRLI